MYADDSSVTSTVTTVKNLGKKLNKDMTSASEWCTDNRMLANAPRTKAMLITTWQKRASLPEQERILKVTLNDTQLENVENDKLLGVHINNNLSWENHINSIFSKENRNIALLIVCTLTTSGCNCGCKNIGYYSIFQLSLLLLLNNY